jgi:prolyl oligopeptidase
MPKLMEPPPHSPIEAVTAILHGMSVTDPYRWLENQESSQTRAWIAAQTRFARAYLDAIPGRERIRARVCELLDVETYDSLQKVGNRYFFRKRLPGREQPCTYFREGLEGADQLLIDPSERGTGKYTAITPLRVSSDGRLLIYEVKQGGERTGTFELLEVHSRKTLPDVLPHGYLRGFAFGPDSRTFYYVHEPADAQKASAPAAFQHVLGASFNDDRQIFSADGDEHTRLHIVPGRHQIGFLVFRFRDKTYTDFHLWPMGNEGTAQPVIQNAEYKFGPVLLNDGRILAITDRECSNLRIVEVKPRTGMESAFTDIIPTSDVPIQHWIAAGRQIFVAYIRGNRTQVEVFDSRGQRIRELPLDDSDTVRLIGASDAGDEVFFERESFTKPIRIYSYSTKDAQAKLWAERKVPIESHDFSHTQVWLPAKDGVRLPMFLVGRPEVLERGLRPTIMTSYGGYGVSMTPQFSVFVAFLIERGCLFALPNIRGGAEFGPEWHNAARRRNRQVAFDDFLSAAQWLIDSGRTEPGKLAIFGGSNSGLLVGAAMTQRPDLFRAVVCMVPMLDMLRYHLFDNAHVWKEEFGTADDSEDFPALLNYSPYHRVRDGVAYPATMIVSGDSDQNCNPLHARKMTARLQAANVSDHPILLDYCRHRGHSPVLPLSERIEALTNRMAFLCDQLGLVV